MQKEETSCMCMRDIADVVDYNQDIAHEAVLNVILKDIQVSPATILDMTSASQQKASNEKTSFFLNLNLLQEFVQNTLLNHVLKTKKDSSTRKHIDCLLKACETAVFPHFFVHLCVTEPVLMLSSLTQKERFALYALCIECGCKEYARFDEQLKQEIRTFYTFVHTPNIEENLKATFEDVDSSLHPYVLTS